MMEPGISIVICCYNSSQRLPETLRHLASQKVPSNVNWEIIVVDNASTDNTAEAAIEYWNLLNNQHVSFNVISEQSPGRIYAFEAALKKSRFDYILTCDDDNWLNEDYVATAFQIMSEDNRIGALGGKGIITAESPPLLDEIEINEVTAHGSQYWAEKDHWVYGAGTVYRKSILNELKKKQWQQICCGRIGTKLLSCEDVELCFVIYLNGYRILADDRLIFKHFVAHKRQQIDFIYKVSYGISYSYYLLYGYLLIINDEKKTIKEISRGLLINNVKVIVKLGLRIIYQLIVKGKKTSVTQLKAFASAYGMASSIIRNKRMVSRHHVHLSLLFKTRKLNP